MTKDNVFGDWIGAEGNHVYLVGSRCVACNTYYFPPQLQSCRNTNCMSTDLLRCPLSEIGKLWSYTKLNQAPPTPYPYDGVEYVPIVIAAVELEREQMIVVGQVCNDIDIGDLKIGMTMRLVIEGLRSNSAEQIWKWRPVED